VKHVWIGVVFMEAVPDWREGLMIQHDPQGTCWFTVRLLSACTRPSSANHILVCRGVTRLWYSDSNCFNGRYAPTVSLLQFTVTVLYSIVSLSLYSFVPYVSLGFTILFTLPSLIISRFSSVPINTTFLPLTFSLNSLTIYRAKDRSYWSCFY
jgi:hypothetical protein